MLDDTDKTVFVEPFSTKAKLSAKTKDPNNKRQNKIIVAPINFIAFPPQLKFHQRVNLYSEIRAKFFEFRFNETSRIERKNFLYSGTIVPFGNCKSNIDTFSSQKIIFIYVGKNGTPVCVHGKKTITVNDNSKILYPKGITLRTKVDATGCRSIWLEETKSIRYQKNL